MINAIDILLKFGIQLVVFFSSYLIVFPCFCSNIVLFPILSYLALLFSILFSGVMELDRMFPLVLAALVAVCYSNSLWCDLVFDDIAAIRDNRDLRPHTPLYNIFQNDFWGTPLKKVTQHFCYFKY